MINSTQIITVIGAFIAFLVSVIAFWIKSFIKDQKKNSEQFKESINEIKVLLSSEKEKVLSLKTFFTDCREATKQRLNSHGLKIANHSELIIKTTTEIENIKCEFDKRKFQKK